MISSSHHVLSIDKIPAKLKKQNSNQILLFHYKHFLLQTRGGENLITKTENFVWSRQKYNTSPEISDTDRTYPSISRCTARNGDNIRHLISTSEENSLGRSTNQKSRANNGESDKVPRSYEPKQNYHKISFNRMKPFHFCRQYCSSRYHSCFYILKHTKHHIE